MLVPNGLLLVSVPDLPTIFRLDDAITFSSSGTVIGFHYLRMYLDDGLDYKHKIMAMKMIYGGQHDQYDYHKVISYRLTISES